MKKKPSISSKKRSAFSSYSVLAVLGVISVTSYLALQAPIFQSVFLGASIGILEKDRIEDASRKSRRLDFSGIPLSSVSFIPAPQDSRPMSDEVSLCGPLASTGTFACAPWMDVHNYLKERHGLDEDSITSSGFQVSAFTVTATDNSYEGSLTLLSFASELPTVVTPE